MRQKLINIYVVISTIIAAATSILEIPPATFFINFLAPNHGDTYSFSFVFLMTCLLFLIPLLIFVIIISSLYKSNSEIPKKEDSGILLTRKKSFTGALIPIPIYLNDKKAGIIKNNKVKFFRLPLGNYQVQAGQGKQASNLISINIKENEKVTLELNINTDNLSPKIELKQKY